MENQNNIWDFEEKDKRAFKFHNFEENPEFIGILIAFVEGNFGKNMVFETKEGETITVGHYTAITEKIQESDIGKPIKIVFKGKERSKTSKKEYMAFDVFVKNLK
jgi:UDP-N-acetylmuramate-alanine ligase